MYCTTRSDIQASICRAQDLYTHPKLAFGVLKNLAQPLADNTPPKPEIIATRKEIAIGTAKYAIELIDKSYEFEECEARTVMSNMKPHLALLADGRLGEVDAEYGLEQAELLRPAVEAKLSRLWKMYNEL